MAVSRKRPLLPCLLLCWLTLLTSTMGQAQKMGDSHLFIEPIVRMGRVIPNASSTSWLSKVSLYSAELRFGKLTDGRHEWEQLFNYPEYGLSLRYAYFNHEVFQHKVALFAYMNGTIGRVERWRFHYQFGLGVAYWSNPYDAITNPSNRFIGSHLNAHIDLALGIDYRISPQVALALSANFSHSSNAALKLPNMGINPLSGTLGVKYYFHAIDTLNLRPADEDSTFKKTNSVYVMVGGGVRQSKMNAISPNGAAVGYYPCSTMQIGFFRCFHPKFRYGAGIDFNYSGELSQHIPFENRTVDKYFSQALFLSFEVLYGCFVFHVSCAAYINRAFNFYEPFYERAGFRFRLGKQQNHFLGASVKAHAGSVDFLEFCYGFHVINF